MTEVRAEVAANDESKDAKKGEGRKIKVRKKRDLQRD